MFGAKVRQPNGGQELAYLVFILEVQIFNLEPFLVAQRIEVLERKHADVWRVVPFVGRNQQAISMELSSDESCCSTGNNQARDQAGITQLVWQLSCR